jgi:hypothetical protein
MAANGQVLVNLGLIHRDNEVIPYWDGWLDWMRTQGWRRFCLVRLGPGAGIARRLEWSAGTFVRVRLSTSTARHEQANKIMPCKFAGQETHLRKDGSSGGHAQQGWHNRWLDCMPARPRRTPRFRIP